MHALDRPQRTTPRASGGPQQATLVLQEAERAPADQLVQQEEEYWEQARPETD